MSDNKKTCELFYHTFNIPIYCFDNEGKLQYYYPETPFFFDRLLPLFSEWQKHDVSILTDKNSLFWAKEETEDGIFIIGPVSTTVFSERIRHALMAEHFIGNDHEDELKVILSSIPRLSLFRFSSTVRTFYQQLCGKLITAEEVTLSDYLKSGEDISHHDLQSRLLSTYYSDVDEGLELYDVSYSAEQELIRNIESGNIEALNNSFSVNDASKFGTLADTAMRNTKNMFIVVIAIASRVAVRNGVSVQVAYKISDLYIQEIEQTSSFPMLTTITRNAVIDYSQRIQALKVPKGISPMVHMGMQFIEQSITQPISVLDVAEYVDKSVSYFSSEFKKETGMNVSSYITKARIDEAKRLLRYTNSSLSYISYFLCFSNQSHFQRVFKNTVGITPMAYRNKKADRK